MNEKTNQTSAVTMASAAISKTPALSLAVRDILDGKEPPKRMTRALGAGELGGLRAGLIDLRHRQAREATRGFTGEPLEDAVRALHRSSTYRARTGFELAEVRQILRERIAAARDGGQVVVLVLPLGGAKAPNVAKTGAGFLPDLAEWTAWSMLAGSADALAQALGREVRILLLPDAGLHTADLGFSAAEVAAHVRQARLDLAWLAIDNVVVVDTLSHLPVAWPGEVAARAAAAAEQVRQDPEARARAEEQASSLLFTKNLRAYAWPWYHEVLVTAGLGDRNLVLPASARADAEELRRAVWQATPHYIGVNHALRTLRVPETIARDLFGVETTLRLTVHAKYGEPRPQLAPNGHLARPGLLPLHGVGVLAHGEERLGLATAFELEALEAEGTALTSEGRFVAFELAATARTIRAA